MIYSLLTTAYLALKSPSVSQNWRSLLDERQNVLKNPKTDVQVLI